MSKSFAISAAKFLVSVLAVTLLASIGGARAESDRIIYAFHGDTDGAYPQAGLIVDKDGNFYGITQLGGGNGGTVFKLTAGGTETVLYAFRPRTRGRQPVGSLILDKRGNLYGTTSEGGRCTISRRGCGTVFQLSPVGVEALLYSFQGGSDGAQPFAGLIADDAGNLFGTTASGDPYGGGTIFELAPNGSETVLHAFLGGSDGAFPFAELISDTAGNFYGTTFGGGGTGCGDGCGTVFKLASDGTETILHSFAGGNDGTNPWSALIIDKAGNLYGTTLLGGTGCSEGNCGIVFKVAPDGTENVLHSFARGKDGAEPEAGLISDNAGNLYGTTGAGGSSGCNGDGCGTVFKLTPDGHETVLHAFEGGTDGRGPESQLILDKAGNLYGTTASGGSSGCNGYGCGTVFSLRR